MAGGCDVGDKIRLAEPARVRKVRDMMVSLAGSGRFCRFFAFGLFSIVIGGSGAWARIGDTPDQMSARMLQPDLGKIFSWPRNMDERAMERVRRENPLFPFEHLLPTSAEDWREQMFWKSALHRQLSNEDGWRVHVYHLKGRSVLELYRRMGAGLNEFEINGILALMRGGQTWRRVDKKKDEAQADTVLGYDYELGEGESATLRARRQGDWLMIYHRRFDAYLLERKARWDENEALRRAEQRAAQEQTAPVSVEGF